VLIALGVEQKLLPSSVVNQFAEDKAAALEEQQGFKVGRKQMRELKEQVTDELLPRAFVRRRLTWAWIDPVNGWLVVDAAAPAKAEVLLEALSKSVDDLPVKSLHTERSPSAAMTDWLLSGEAPAASASTATWNCAPPTRARPRCAMCDMTWKARKSPPTSVPISLPENRQPVSA